MAKSICFYLQQCVFFIFFGAIVSYARPQEVPPRQEPSYLKFAFNATDLPSEDYYDYMVVGDGTAACPLEATLSHTFRVILRERGGIARGEPSLMIQDDFSSTHVEVNAFDSPAHAFTSEDGLLNTGGRVISGSSAINTGFYSQANMDFYKNSGFNWDLSMVNESYWVKSTVAGTHATTAVGNGQTNYSDRHATTLPLMSGLNIGAYNYIVTVGIGSPSLNLSLEIDTGSDITWTQCLPCVSCYKQHERIFESSQSTSHSYVSSGSPQCSMLSDAQRQSCNDTCKYKETYADGSRTIGFLSKDRIRSPPSQDIFEEFIFGCGMDNHGDTLKGSAGVLGLGRGILSFVEQTAQIYNRTFSYCLPSTSTSSGFLTFGSRDAAASVSVSYTPLITVPYSASLYGVWLEDIAVNGIPLGIPSIIFLSPGTVIDSGTPISVLPQTAFSELRYEFRKQMMFDGHKLLPSSISRGDTCYDLTGKKQVYIPKVSLVFVEGMAIELDPTGILHVFEDRPEGCLAFNSVPDYTAPTILGSVQQRKIEVIHDVGGGRIGFRASECV